MTRCCEFLSKQQENPTDALITPLIRLSELMGRINEHFSYDDVDDADIQGEPMLQMSMVSFRSELDVIVNAIPPDVRENSTSGYFCYYQYDSPTVDI